MSSGDEGGALNRVARDIGGMQVVDQLAAMSGSDFTTVMLEVVRRRAALRAAGVPRVQVALTPLSDAGERIAGATAASLGTGPAEIIAGPDRASGRGYYRDLCFKVNALIDDTPAEIGDGGFTDWTARLLANGKERLLIAGYGIDRLVSCTGGQASSKAKATGG